MASSCYGCGEELADEGHECPQGPAYDGPHSARKKNAVFSPCRMYRYMLERRISPSPRTCLFIMLNPSTADEVQDDPTVNRCRSFALSLDCGRLIVCNLYALRATDPRKLKQVEDPVGQWNDYYILKACQLSDIVIAAWGNNHLQDGRVEDLLGHLTIAKDVYRLGDATATGSPRHPLYVRGDEPLQIHRRIKT